LVVDGSAGGVEVLAVVPRIEPKAAPGHGPTELDLQLGDVRIGLDRTVKPACGAGPIYEEGPLTATCRRARLEAARGAGTLALQGANRIDGDGWGRALA
jgi:hypothetical protein